MYLVDKSLLNNIIPLSENYSTLTDVLVFVDSIDSRFTSIEFLRPPKMKFKYYYLLVLSVSIYSCNKDELTSLNSDQVTETEKTAFLISTAEHSAQEAELFELINNYRLSINLNVLEFDNTSHYYAQEHSSYMILKGTTSHAKFGKRAKQISKLSGASYVAENVAKDYDSVTLAFEAWLESNGHSKNIEGDFTHSAIGIAENNAGDLYFTQLFFR